MKTPVGNDNLKKVSVPFRGLWFLNDFRAVGVERVYLFPSPFGVYGFSILKKVRLEIMPTGFPSPFGVYGFSMMESGFPILVRLYAFPSPFGVYGFSIGQSRP